MTEIKRARFLDLRRLFSICLIPWLGLPVAQAENVFSTERLTDFQSPLGRVERAQTSPDGERIVYVASQDRWGVNELYSVPVGGGSPVKLNTGLVSGGDVFDFVISPDSAHVIYRADAEIDEKVELYRVPILGGTVAKMNGSMVPAGDVQDFYVSPSSQHVVYTANQDHYQKLDLYSHSLATGAVAKLNPLLDPTEEVFEVAISPDSEHVVFTQGRTSSPSSERSFFSAPIGGGSVATLELTDVEAFMITADSQRVLYITPHSFQLRSIAITGGASTDLLGETFAVGGELVWTSDRMTLLFFALEDGGAQQLYKLDVASGEFEVLSDQGAAGSTIVLSENDATVLYCGDGGWRTSPLAGGTSSQVFDSCSREPKISADGTRVILVGGLRVLAAPADGSVESYDLAPFNVSHQQGVQYAAFDESGSHVIYISDFETRYLDELYSVPWTGGVSTKLNAPAFAGYLSLRLHEVSDFVLYSGVQDHPDLRELYRIDPAGGPSTKLSGSMLGTGGDTRQFEFSPDGSRVVFIANQRDGVGDELWTYDIASGDPALLLNATLLPDVQQVGVFAIDSTGSRVAFLAVMEPEGQRQVFSVPIQGGTATLLSEAVDNVSSFGLSGSGDWLYYTISDEGLSTYRRVPAGGGAVETFAEGVTRSRLSPGRQRLAFQAGSGNPWQTVQIASGQPTELTAEAADHVAYSPDGTRIVYWLDVGFGELFSVSSAGGAATRLHDGTSPCNGSHGEFVISRDSSRVIFWCGGSQYSVPIDGGPVATLTPFTLSDITTSSDGSTVFGIRQPGDSDFELISIPILGGSYSTLATFPRITPFLGSQILDLEVAPGDQFVFLRKSIATGVENYVLWGVPVNGDPALRYNADNTQVETFDFSADGTDIFFVQGLLEFEIGFPRRSELMRMPISGGEALSHHPQMPFGGEVASFKIFGETALYSADLEQDEVNDLYLTRLNGIFSDGFESGDFSVWSSTTP